MPKGLSLSEFQEHVIKKEKALADFFTDCCGHCNELGHVIYDIGREMKRKVHTMQQKLYLLY